VLGRGDVGHRVVARRFVEMRDDRPLFTDVVGDLVAWDDESITVVTRHGPVTVPTAAIVAGKRIPPSVPRRPARPGAGTPEAGG
jgi:N-acetylglutamate synthase